MKNIDQLIFKIKDKLKNKFTSNNDILITRTRHRHNLNQCLDHLKDLLRKKMQKIMTKQLKT